MMPEQPDTPIISVILPVRNEEANIARAVLSLASQTLDIEIIVVNDGSTDRTGSILAELAGRYSQLRVLESPELPAGWTGKNYAAALGAEQARGKWLLFTDADVVHLPDALAQGIELAKRHRVELVSFSPEQEMGTLWERVVIPFVYWRLAKRYPYDLVNDPREREAAANGQWLLISRHAYQAAGGHSSVRDELLEDVALARRVKQAGFRLRFTSGVGVARTRMYRRWSDLWQGWSKNLFLLFDREILSVITAVGSALVMLLAAVFCLLGLWRIGYTGSGFWLVRLLAELAIPGALGGVCLLALAHFRYGLGLYWNRFPVSHVLYYLPANILFAALMVSSWRKHRGEDELVWKGRSYDVAAQ